MSHTRIKLERRARALLRLYPAEYRRERAEEIIDTLLEASPPGRSFPSARDTWALIAGGRHARAARNGGLSTNTNLRLALVLGISVFLSGTVGYPVIADLLAGGSGGTPWLTIGAAALITVTPLAPWLGRWTAIAVLIIALGGLLGYVTLMTSALDGRAAGVLAALLIVLGLFAVLSGGRARPPAAWIWLPCVFPATLVAVRLMLPSASLPGFLMDSATYVPQYAELVLAVVVVCWLATDARPAFGICTALLLMHLVEIAEILTFAGGSSRWLEIANDDALLLQLALVLAFMLPVTWLLRRQTAPPVR